MNVDLQFEMNGHLSVSSADTFHPHTPDSTRQSNYDQVTWVVPTTFQKSPHVSLRKPLTCIQLLLEESTWLHFATSLL